MALDSTYTIDHYGQYYFGGNQCRLYFDGVYVGEVPYLEFSLSNNKAPIYSYNSTYYKIVAKGNVLVQGNFSVNLTDRGYISDIMSHIKSNKLSSDTQDTTDAITSIRGLSPHDVISYMDTCTGAKKEGLITALTELYWGTVKTKGGRVPWVRPDELDMVNNKMDYDGFDIVMVYGVPMGHDKRFTIKQINDVHITGESLVNDTSGQPIMQQFSFFARKIDGEDTIFYPSKRGELDREHDTLDTMDDIGRAYDEIVKLLSVASISKHGGGWIALYNFGMEDSNLEIVDVRVYSVSSSDPSKQPTWTVVIEDGEGMVRIEVPDGTNSVTLDTCTFGIRNKRTNVTSYTSSMSKISPALDPSGESTPDFRTIFRNN